MFKNSHWLLLLRMDFRETKVELRSHLINCPRPGRKGQHPQGKDMQGPDRRLCDAGDGDLAWLVVVNKLFKEII